MLSLDEILLKRRSVRHFTDEKISDEQIHGLLEAGMSGPSAANKQPWEFYVIKDPQLRKELKKATKYTNYDAPLIIVICGNKERFIMHPYEQYWVEDCSAATQNILLKAVDLDLGCVWCGVYPQMEEVVRVQEMLKLDDHLIPLNIIFIGRPSKEVEGKNYYDENKVHIL